jgi:hypothetical protein
MPYQFKDYVDTYVDPQTVKISEMLRDRYMQNFQANDTLSMAVDQMQAALPFENDVAKKKELQFKIDNTLNQIVDAGDLENATFAISNAARNFTKEYTPIKQNYDAWQGAIGDLQKRLGAKENGVNAEQLKYAPAYMAKGYKGFEIDEATGRVKEGSMFKAPTIYSDPDVMSLIKSSMEILHSDSYKGSLKEVNIGDGMLELTTTEGVTKISLEKVRDVLEPVMKRPDVANYFEQLSQMKTYSVLQSTDVNEVINTQITNYKTAIDAINAKTAAGEFKDEAQKKLASDQITLLTSEMKKAQSALQDSTAGELYIKDKIKEDYMAPYVQYGEAKAYTETQSDRIYDYSKLYIEDRKFAKENSPLYIQGEVTLADKYGATVAKKYELMTSNEKAILDQRIILNSGTTSPEAKQDAAREMNRLRNQTETIKQQITTAGNRIGDERLQNLMYPGREGFLSTGMDEWKAYGTSHIYETLKEMYPWASTGELYLKYKETFDNIGDEDLAQFRNKYKEKFGQEDYYTKIQKDESNFSDIQKVAYREATRTFEQEMSKQFAAEKTSKPFNYGTIDAPNVYEGAGLRKQIDNFFVGKPLPEYFQVTNVTEDDEVVPLAGNDETLKGYQVASVGWNKVDNIYELNLVHKEDGTSKTVHMDGNMIKGSTIDVMLNSPDVKFAGVVTDMATGLQAGEKSHRTVSLLTGANSEKQVLMEVSYKSEGESFIRFLDTDGNTFKDKEGKAIALSQRNSLGSQTIKDLLSKGFPVQNADGTTTYRPALDLLR